MGTLIARIKNWKTTLMGTALGAVGVAVITKVLSDAGCNFEQVQWAGIITFGFTQLMGLIATDNGKAV